MRTSRRTGPYSLLETHVPNHNPPLFSGVPPWFQGGTLLLVRIIPPNHNRWMKFTAAGTIGAAILGGAGALSGCTKPLFSPEEERSQFDRYDAIRAQRSAPYIEDEFGRRQPNLRGRLLTKQ